MRKLEIMNKRNIIHEQNDPQFVLTELAAILYRDKLLNLEQASRMAGISVKKFINELEIRNIKIVESDKFRSFKDEIDGA